MKKCLRIKDKTVISPFYVGFYNGLQSFGFIRSPPQVPPQVLEVLGAGGRGTETTVLLGGGIRFDKNEYSQ